MIIAITFFGLRSGSVVEAATPVTARVRASFTQTPQGGETRVLTESEGEYVRTFDGSSMPVLEAAGGGRGGFLSDAASGKRSRLRYPTRRAVLKSNQRASARNPNRKESWRNLAERRSSWGRSRVS